MQSVHFNAVVGTRLGPHRCPCTRQLLRPAHAVKERITCENDCNNVTRRSALQAALGTAIASLVVQSQPAAAAGQVSAELIKAFQDAFAAQGDFQAMEEAWTRAIKLAPANSAAWSNRGTARLQTGRGQEALEDLEVAVKLEEEGGGPVNSLLLNNLGNAEGAVGQWEAAMRHYKEAGQDPEMEAIALANYGLAAFEVGQDDLAVRTVRQLLRRDSQYLDMKAALVAFLWGSGQRAAAEAEWESLQQSQDGLGAAIYGKSSVVDRVKGRWPPRATAALGAFLSLSSSGSAVGYDFQMHNYTFPEVSTTA